MNASSRAPGGSIGAGKGLYLMSWNVAGLKTTLSFINKFHKGGFEAWLAQHGVDILCIQETKMALADVRDKPQASGARVEGYESFWAFNSGGGKQQRGLNGVATLVRKGLTLRACGCPLGDPELDAEGRCVLTEHHSFVIFNVYVPNGGMGNRLPFKKVRVCVCMSVRANHVM